MNNRHIRIFDTTLRDGQQCPGAGISFEKNIAYAKLAAKAKVDVLEAGFPSASETEFKIVNTIAIELSKFKEGPIVTALCQLRENQVDNTIAALAPAISNQKARLHTYVPVDRDLMVASLGKKYRLNTILENIYKLVKKAKDHGLEVEFSPEGYSQMGDYFDFTTDAIRSAISAGATIINCPDTMGRACKLQNENYFVAHMKQHAAMMQREFPNIPITWSVHCHNDFGLALENTMNAIFFGPATQIEGCFNGIGERSGNVSLEQCIMLIKYFGSLCKNTYTQIQIDSLQEISDFVSREMLPRQPHWPITGDNAAKHSSGGHTNAILKNPLAYQPFDPREIGKEISLVFGPLSGSNHAKTIIEKYGYTCDEEEKTTITQFIKNYYHERRKGITDQELLQAYFVYRANNNHCKE